MVETTGMRFWARSDSTMAGLTLFTSPTKPRSGLRRPASMSPASSPESPTANGPWVLMLATMSRLTLPTSTMRAMSRVSASVTRRPSRNSDTLPSRSMSSPIWGPPPCTTTTRMPTEWSSTMSAAKDSASSGSVMALPPYFTTTVWPQNSRM